MQTVLRRLERRLRKDGMMSDGRSPRIELNNGVEIPALGLGVFLTPRERTAEAVATAISCGYRLVDTAAAYENEREVGRGIRDSGISRDELFVTTKLWMTDFGRDSALRAFDASLRRLELDYVDLYLLHWPVPSGFGQTIAAYKALEDILAGGLTRAIGVSNFNPRHLEDLVRATDVVPALNQVELHPYFNQRRVREADAARGVVTQSWSPIGGTHERSRRAGRAQKASLLEDPVLVRLAEQYGKTPAQIVLRWHVEHGLSAIPKSVSVGRIAENIDIFDFALAPDDLAAVDALDTGVRSGADPEAVDAATFS